MNILIIEIEEMMINNNDINIEMKKKKYFINISFMIDLLYNIIIYEKYEIELLFKWIINHLKENHEIKMKIINIIKYLNLIKLNMILKKVKE